MRIKLDARHDFLRKNGIPPNWKPVMLGDLADVIGGGTPSRDEGRFWQGGTIPWATPTDLTANESKYIGKTAESITDTGLAASAATLLPKGAVLYTSRATIGAKAMATVEMATNQGFANFLPRRVNGEYLYYLLDLLTPIIKRLGAGTTFDEVSKRDIRRLHCAVPIEEDEQSTIAHIIDSVDTAIERTRQVLAKVTTLRRGLMQELLPPWIGFKRLDPRLLSHDVESIEIARDVCDVCNGSTPSRKEHRYWRNGTIPWLPTGKVHDRVIGSANEFVTASALRECSISVLPRGTVLVGMIGQGRTRGMTAYLDIEACINQNFGAFTPRRKVSGRWLFHYFDFHYNRLREIGGGTNQGAINCFLLKRLRLPLPRIDRQRDVAAALDGIEELGQSYRSVFQQLEQLKHSLMHDLLTGVVRVGSTLLVEEKRS